MPSPTRLKKLKLKKKLTNAKAAASKTNSSRTANQNSSIGESAAKAISKKPADMTADEISTAIAEIDAQIEQGKALLSADASLLQRALFALKMALLELGGVDPELAVKDRETLEKLIAVNSGNATPDPATQKAVTKALDAVNQAQAEVAKRNSARQTEKGSAYPGLDMLKQKKPEELSTEEVEAALNDIDRSIAESKLLLSENASLLQRALYALKMALLDLGNVTPKLHYEMQAQLEAILAARAAVEQP